MHTVYLRRAYTLFLIWFADNDSQTGAGFESYVYVYLVSGEGPYINYFVTKGSNDWSMLVQQYNGVK